MGKKEVDLPKNIIKPSEDAVLYEHGEGWGDSVIYNAFPNRVSGHKQRRPQVGDVLTTKMQSGKVLVSIFQNVRNMSDPQDMFFATVEPVGYAEDIDFKLPEKYIHKGFIA